MTLDETIIWAKETLSFLGPVRHRKMFGGAGLYSGELFFAILDEGKMYLKADTVTRQAFEEAGSVPFEYEAEGGKMAQMNYFLVTPEMMESEETLGTWVDLALGAAERVKKKKRTS